MNKDPAFPLTYKDAGVDIEAGNALVERIKGVASRTRRPEVMAGLGGFGALCKIPSAYRSPVLVSGTDGVGTKLRLAIDLQNHAGVGIDLVAMCVNDLVVCGAEPLFFLDYYATGALNVGVAASVVESIGRGCELAGCALIGGETAEMPGMYDDDDYDLAGFCVGVVEEDRIVDGSAVRNGDILIGLESSGPHSNGYSLIRKILEVNAVDPRNCSLAGQSLAEHLLAPTRIYVPAVLSAIRDSQVHAVAHITGGGLYENIPRVLPNDLRAVIDPGAWPRKPVFEWLQHHGNIENREMYRTFNCGIGMVLCAPQSAVESLLILLKTAGETPHIIGTVTPRDQGEAVVIN